RRRLHEPEETCPSSWTTCSRLPAPRRYSILHAWWRFGLDAGLTATTVSNTARASHCGAMREVLCTVAVANPAPDRPRRHGSSIDYRHGGPAPDGDEIPTFVDSRGARDPAFPGDGRSAAIPPSRAAV